MWQKETPLGEKQTPLGEKETLRSLLGPHGKKEHLSYRKVFGLGQRVSDLAPDKH